ncbi:MAG: hypothetical protein JWO03_2211 [Bacteroidetes bacterium]|nr:hypothetical protein [Bacteroidota bacterium]
MTKRITGLALIAIVLLISGTTMTSCQNKANPENATQTDTPQVAPPDMTRTPPPDTIKPDTTKMKDENKKHPLTLVIDNLESTSAPVEVSIYAPDNKFPKENGQLKKYRFNPTGNTLTATITDLEYGQYAVATYQDLDADGKIGTNVIGIPTDPYGFSNNYKPKIKAPAFKDCAFAYDDKSDAVSITMIRK